MSGARTVCPSRRGVVTAKQRNRTWRKTFGLSIIGWRYSRIDYRPRVAARPQYPGTPSAHPQWVRLRTKNRWEMLPPLSCRLCCKSLKTPGEKFPARRRNKSRSLIDVASGSLPKSPVSLSPGDEVPHMFTRKPRLQLEKFAINGAKVPEPDIAM